MRPDRRTAARAPQPGQAPEKPRAQGGRCAGLPDSQHPPHPGLRRSAARVMTQSLPERRVAERPANSGPPADRQDAVTAEESEADAALRRGDLVQRGVPYAPARQVTCPSPFEPLPRPRSRSIVIPLAV